MEKTEKINLSQYESVKGCNWHIIEESKNTPSPVNHNLNLPNFNNSVLYMQWLI